MLLIVRMFACSFVRVLYNSLIISLINILQKKYYVRPLSIGSTAYA